MSSSDTTDISVPTRRRRWPWIVAAAVLALVLLALAAAAWYTSSLLGDGIRVDRGDRVYDLTIEGVNETSDPVTVRYRPDEDADGSSDYGFQAMVTEDGDWVRTEAGSRAGERLVLDEAQTLPQAAERAELEGWYYQDPSDGLDLDFTEVQIDTPLGPAPAWFIDGDRDTWAIFTHGRGAERGEGLRALETLADLGLPTLMMTYRNDEVAPAGNGYGQFGKDEWEDLQAAVEYAIANGASDIVLVGNSMGAATQAAFLLNSPDADVVTAAFWDSPALDFADTVDVQAAELGVPGPIVSLGKWVSSLRFGIDFDAVDYVSRASDFEVPILIVHSPDDETISVTSSRSFVEASDPAQVRLEEFPGADHTGLWNKDRERYEELLRTFITEQVPSS